MFKNKTSTASFLLFTALLLISQLTFAQFDTPLWSKQEIEQNEKDLISTYKKYQKSQTNKSKQESFLNEFNERVNFHNAQIKLAKNTNDQNTDWINWINRLESLNFIYSKTSDVLTKNNIELKNYSLQLDSVKNAAVISLYEKGKNAINDKKIVNNLAVAYRSLSTVQTLHPGYESTASYLEVLKNQGNKTAVFDVIKFSNLGNYINIQSSNGSPLTDFIINSTLKSLSNTVGIQLKKTSDANTAYFIQCNWESINYGMGNSMKTVYNRSATIKDNKVNATVTYNTETMPVNTSFIVSIVDKASNSTIAKTNIKTNDFVQYVTLTYTGDKDALTYDDNEALNKTRIEGISNFKQNQLKVIYEKSIHQKLCEFINNTLAW